MSNKAVSVYANAMKRQQEEKKKEPSSRKSRHPGSRKSSRPETRKPDEKSKQTSGKQGAQPVASPEVMLVGQMEDVRKVVREVGRERADVGLTAAEKETLREIAFARTQAGKRTTINDVVRVAVNWLLQDYQTRKKKSLLLKTLDAVQS